MFDLVLSTKTGKNIHKKFFKKKQNMMLKNAVLNEFRMD